MCRLDYGHLYIECLNILGNNKQVMLSSALRIIKPCQAASRPEYRSNQVKGDSTYLLLRLYQVDNFSREKICLGGNKTAATLLRDRHASGGGERNRKVGEWRGGNSSSPRGGSYIAVLESYRSHIVFALFVISRLSSHQLVKARSIWPEGVTCICVGVRHNTSGRPYALTEQN